MSQIIMFPCGADTDFPGGVDGFEGNCGKHSIRSGNVIKTYLYGHRDHVKLNVSGFMKLLYGFI